MERAGREAEAAPVPAKHWAQTAKKSTHASALPGRRWCAAGCPLGSGAVCTVLPLFPPQGSSTEGEGERERDKKREREEKGRNKERATVSSLFASSPSALLLLPVLFCFSCEGASPAERSVRWRSAAGEGEGLGGGRGMERPRQRGKQRGDAIFPLCGFQGECGRLRKRSVCPLRREREGL